MLKEGIKKEMMFFTRSFRVWGILVAAVLLAAAAPPPACSASGS